MDPDVKKETIGSVHNAHYGQIMIYRYHSPYIGEWYVAALPKSWGYVEVELRAHPPTNPECYRDEFGFIVQNIKLPRSVPKEEMEKKGRVIGGAR